MRRSRSDIVLENRIPSPKKISPPSPPAPHVADPLVLDWGLLSAAAEPSKAVSVCCVCGEAHTVAAPDELNNINSDNGNNYKIGDTSSPTPSNHRRRGGSGADESFVVLPADSNPVLSESYFSLPRNGFSSGDETQTYTQDGMSIQADDGTTRDLSVRLLASSPLGASTSDRGGLLPRSGGMSVIGDGPAAGWTRAGFGAGSTMLESIAQISHAGLSDSVRKECFLHNLAKKRPARRILEGAGGGLGDIAGIEDGRKGAPSSSEDPILCWHCCSSLLDRIEEDSRLADREALAHRDFVDTLDGIEDSDDPGMDNSESARHEGAPPQAADGHLGNPKGPRSTPKDSLVYSNAELTFAKALEMAQQTSDQLRAEMSLIEGQRRTLCVRASNTWKALSELAWTRRVLGEECRELLQISKEVAKNASDLSERTALRELFSIRHDHGFPTINGYRLARAPDDKRRLHWNEINAAWGEAVLLVRCVANAVGFCSRRFRLVPMSCASRVIELGIEEDGGQSHNTDSLAPPPVMYAHDLFSTGGRNGDSRHRILGAIQAFVACSSEVMAEVERHVLERRLFTKGVDSGGVGGGVPYRQTEDSIGGMTIASLKNQAYWKAWLCQLMKNLEWALEAASSLCVS